MRLLIITQKVDRNDPVLGFFHNWIIEFSNIFERVICVALEKGTMNLPAKVNVLSLGKESRVTKLTYVLNFFKIILRERKNYDAVFVHMNQEYVLLGGLLWRLLGKKVYMWRNHSKGTIWTNIAVSLCYKVFCTSEYSYTKRFKKTVLMPVGIDENLFFDRDLKRNPNSFVYVGRISPVKNLKFILDAFYSLAKTSNDWSFHIYGDAIERDKEYDTGLLNFVKEKSLDSYIKFYPSVTQDDVPQVFSSYEFFVNATSSGSLDKTIFESMLCGCLPIISNKNVALDWSFIFKEDDVEDLQIKLNHVLKLSSEEKEAHREKNLIIAQSHSLKNLVISLQKEIC